MNERIKMCLNCATLLNFNKRLPDQRYCSRMECQNARRRAWIAYKLTHDSDYKEGKKISQEKWVSKHPKYWKKYKSSQAKCTTNNDIIFQLNLSKNDMDKLIKTNSRIVIDCKNSTFVDKLERKFTNDKLL